MKESIKILLKEYQVRKTIKQKQAFVAWLREHLSVYGYVLREEKYSKSGNNLLVGNAVAAEVVLTAHYDTPPNYFFPVVMGFSNWLSLFLSQIIILLPLGLYYALYFCFIAPFLRGSFLSFFFNLPPLIYGFQILCGAANRHTANDNTSGVAVLISVLEKIPEEERKKVCVVFFDQEELGLVGSKYFYAKYKKAMQNKPLINFDCVSDGDTLTIVVKKKCKDTLYFEALTKAVAEAVQGTGKTSRFADALWNVYCSDQLHFSHGVGVVAAKKAPVFGYYINRIHSGWDTKFDNENIEIITAAMLQFIRTLPGKA